MKLSSSLNLVTQLAKLNIHSPIDAISYLPIRYDDYTLSETGPTYHRDRVVLYGQVVTPVVTNMKRTYNVISFGLQSHLKTYFKIVAFNRSYLVNIIKEGEFYTVIAYYDKKYQSLNLANIVKGEVAKDRLLKPIYRLPKQISQHTYSQLVKRHYPYAKEEIQQIIPQSLVDKYRLKNKTEAYYDMHFPHNRARLLDTLRTFKYEEALLYSIKIAHYRQQNKLLIKENKLKIDLSKINDFVRKLPYKLTKDQLQAVREIVLDINSDQPMYRMVQGDVGSGKTVVAMICLYANYLRGDQGVLMAPTDSLAKQHYQTLIALAQDSNLNIGLLVGSLKKSEREAIKQRILDGVFDIVIGTHALFSHDIVYQSLGLAIIDEQHRFGVNQRVMLTNKGNNTDLLLMSATPIPRSLAMTIYGDLDMTIIKQFPILKRQVNTIILASENKKIEQLINQSLIEKRPIFVIAPLIDENDEIGESAESLYQIYKNKYPSKVALLHGKLSNEQKDTTFAAFSEGKIPILVATTIIEVGIDIPKANLMIVYESQRFGLAALHQLRGRIGRDGSLANFVLISDDQTPSDRLDVLLKSNDGFFIAEQDLKLRGPGEMLGQRQAGFPSFVFINPLHDLKILQSAKQDALDIINNPNASYQTLLKKALEDHAIWLG